MRPFFFFPRLLALLAAIGLTLRAQAFWQTDDLFAMFFPVVLWLALIIDWTVRQSSQWKRNRRLERGMWAVPLGLVLVVLCGLTHLPLKWMSWRYASEMQASERQLLAWAQKGELSKAGGIRANKGEFGGRLTPEEGVGHPFQIAHSHGDTRFFLWENRPNFSVKSAVGLAYCPGDTGCKRASFSDYWDYSGDVPEHIVPPFEYYWDYSHGTPEYVSLGHNWYATKVSVEDVGD